MAERNHLVAVRHGETAWTRSGQHTSRTDVPLTELGCDQARHLQPRLEGRSFASVLTSPRSRAMDTATLAGFGSAVVDEDLVEWDYGDYEGRTTAEIREDPATADWSLWRDGVPNGETASLVAVRADRVIARALAADGDTLVFSHGHFLRVLAARWLELDPDVGRLLFLSPASVSELGWEREQRVLTLWNDVR